MRNATLIVRAGPMAGASFPLLDGGFTIGREESNALCLEGDRSVSRNHCVIEAREGGFSIRDLDSANRTYVNDAPVGEHDLEHGDEIRVGRSTFVFVLNGRAAPPRNATVELEDAGPVSGKTVVLRRADAAAFRPEAIVEEAVRSAKVARSVRSLLRAYQVVSSACASLEDLGKRLLDVIFDAVPAQRAAVLVRDPASEGFVSAVHFVRGSDETKIFRIPRGIVERVLAEREGVCVNDALSEGGGIVTSETIVQARVTALMAVPFVAGETAMGAFYLDTSDAAVRFGEDDLQLLAGIAGIAAGAIENVRRLAEVERENQRLMDQLAGENALVGRTDAMRGVYRFISKVTRSDATVLVVGSSGTGKELVARAIHRSSPRSAKPFMAINCAAVTDTLLESEFFGHEKGAFTGATAQKKGKLEEAEGGTVFLDEIGELALSLQAKLLRVLQEREITRVGGNRTLKVNIRVIAATNRDLEVEIAQGRFRQDLFYRLNVVSIKMPDLKDRREDVPVLAQHFLEKHSKSCGRRVTGFSNEALACLSAYDWPGNVRELENAVERAIVLGSTEMILPEDLPDAVGESASSSGAGEDGVTFQETIRDFKKQLVRRALDQAGGSFVEAAKLLGLHPNNLHRLVKTLNLRVS